MLPISTKLIDGELDDKLRLLYGDALEAQKQKYLALTDAFEGAFGESDDAVLFFGPMLPHHDLLQRTLESFHAQPPTESLRYAHADPERRRWQTERNLRRALADRDDAA